MDSNRRSYKEEGISAKTAVLICAGVTAVALLLLLGVFMYNHWGRYDDTEAIQGNWRPVSSGDALKDSAEFVMVISDTTIQITPDARYSYTLDSGSKIINLSFLDLEGTAGYRFSPDRNTLALIDGKTSGFAMFWENFGYFVSCVWAELWGNSAPDPAEGDGVTLLKRVASGKEKID